MRFPSLPRIVIPIACTADWSTMRVIEADGRARLCRACDTPVYDSRSMTRGELHRLIVKHEGSLPCLRLHQRPDGTIVTGSCFAPVVRAGRLLWLKVALAAVAFWSAVFGFRSWMARPKSNPAPPVAAAAPPAPSPSPPSPIHIDADKPVPIPRIRQANGYTMGRARRHDATMGKGKVTPSRKRARGDHSLDDLLKGL